MLRVELGDWETMRRYAAPIRFAVFVDEQGNAYVDLSAPPEPVAGSSTELLLAYGVVDSIILNCPEVKAVQILFGGREVSTLAGHLDLSRPLGLNKRFLDRVNAAGPVHLTHTTLGGRFTVRLVVGQRTTEERHVRAAWDILSAAADEALKG